MVQKGVVFLCCVAVVLFLSGCAGSKAFSSADRERIKKISVSYKNVKYGDESGKSILYFSTPGKGWSGMGGVVGLAIYEATKNSSYEDIVWENLLRDDMGKKAIADAFSQQFCQGLFQCVPVGEEDASLHVKVNVIGISPKIGGNIGAELVDRATGQTLWKGREYYSHDKRLAEYPFDEYAEKPESLQKGVSTLAEIIASDLAKRVAQPR